MSKLLTNVTELMRVTENILLTETKGVYNTSVILVVFFLKKKGS